MLSVNKLTLNNLKSFDDFCKVQEIATAEILDFHFIFVCYEGRKVIGFICGNEEKKVLHIEKIVCIESDPLYTISMVKTILSAAEKNGCEKGTLSMVNESIAATLQLKVDGINKNYYADLKEYFSISCCNN